jgi:hypothetical protein
MPDGNGGGRPVEPQERFCNKTQIKKKKPNRNAGLLSNALNGRE